MNAAMIAADPTPEGVDRLRHLWTNGQNDIVAPFGKFDGVRLLTHRGVSLQSNAGLRFSSDPDDLEELPPRKHQRTPLSAMVTLRRRSGGSYRVATSDVSPDGCNLHFVERPEVNETHWIKFDGLEALEVQVRWVKDFNAGVRFTRPIHPAVFAMLFPA